MTLKSIGLNNFRNFEKQTFKFDSYLTIIIGENAVGKTNLLESIFFICTGRGIKDDKQEELIMLHKNTMSVNGIFEDKGTTHTFRVHVEREIPLVKAYLVDSTRKMLARYRKFTPPVVIFSPKLISIIDGQPSLRRKYIDSIISELNIEYKKRLNNYENALRKRNKIIEKQRDQLKLKEQLRFWDTYLIEQADYVCEKREWFVGYVNSHREVDSHSFSLKYVRSTISQTTLSDSFEKQYYQRRTLVGPQRDDFRVLKYDTASDSHVDAHAYCSRGEQRLGLFWLIINELSLYDEYLDHPPLLLLDDIFSELDNSNKHLITNLVKEYQTVITTTEEEIVESLKDQAVLIHI